MTLQEKLRPAGVLAEEADRQHEVMLAFRRHQRSSLGLRSSVSPTFRTRSTPSARSLPCSDVAA
jgi:hypothetical protein